MPSPYTSQKHPPQSSISSSLSSSTASGSCKRPAPPSEQYGRTTPPPAPTMGDEAMETDNQISQATISCTFTPPATYVLNQLATLIGHYDQHDSTRLSVTDWKEICTEVISTVLNSVTMVDADDDDSDARAVKEVKHFLKSGCDDLQRLGEDETSLDTDGYPPALSTPIQSIPTPSSQPSTFENKIFETLRDMRSHILKLENKVFSQTPRHPQQQSMPNPPGNQKPSPKNPAPPTLVAKPTYAQVTSSSPPAVHQKQPTRPPEHIRYVVRFHGKPRPLEQRSLPINMTTAINNRLKDIPTSNGLKVLGANWNPAGNLILTFPPNTSHNLIRTHFPTFRDALCLTDNQTISHDTRWSKLILAGVLARIRPSDEVFSEEALHETFLTNPTIQKLRITQYPRWLRLPTSIEGLKSSVSFAFEDPDGSVARSLLKQSPNIFMFGAPVKVKRWVDKPRLRQCSICWKLDHTASRCRRDPRCRLCGDPHPESNHRQKCSKCKAENRPEEATCNHPNCCVNCREPHEADSANCTERRKFAIPTSTPAQPLTTANDDMTS